MARKIEVPVSDDLLNQIDLDGFQKVIIYYPDRATSEKIAEKYQREFSERETQSRDFMTISETCTYMNTSYGTVKKWITEDGLKMVHLDGKKFISKETLKKWLHDHEQ